MTRTLQLLASLMIILAVLGCSGKDDDDNESYNPPLEAGNNSGVISGAQIGTGQFNQDDLHALLPVNLLSVHPALTLGQAYISRDTVGSPIVRWMASVKNTGDEALSGVNAGGLTYLDLAGQPMVVAGATTIMLTGSIGVTSLGYDSSCLAPGETGWLLGSSVVDFDEIGSIRLSYLADGGESPDNPEAKIGPVEYEIASNVLDVEISNTGSWAGQVVDGSKVMLLDIDGMPLYWQSLFTESGETETVESQSELTLTSSVTYGGASGTIRVYVNFEDLPEDRSYLPTGL